ncbi:hypothetical protein ASF38_03275 [Aeromicrobium sp. Leaf272]|nr:hypothetical protein ASF38_03275 [Aeromicrobium sp. Leaf272]
MAAKHLEPTGRLLLQLGSREQVELLERPFTWVGLEVVEVREEGQEGSSGVVALVAPTTRSS